MSTPTTKPISGAARYFAGVNTEGKPCVFMVDTEGYTNEIKRCKTLDAALTAADKWQIKENKAVEKAAK